MYIEVVWIDNPSIYISYIYIYNIYISTIKKNVHAPLQKLFIFVYTDEAI